LNPAVPELLRKGARLGTVAVSPPPTVEVGEFGDVHFICVGTPQKKG